jgi:hypothetical protein
MTSRTSRMLLLASLTGLLAVAGVSSGSAGAASKQASALGASQTLVFYGTEAKRIFINNTDDLARGQGHNPFGNYTGSSITTRANEKLFGPFPGDEGEFQFKLYTDSAHKNLAGSAVFICWYGYNADDFCDSAFNLGEGMLIGKGGSNFNAPTSTFSILGGTAKYRGIRGSVEVVGQGKATQPQPVARVVPMLQAQKLTISLHPG